MTIKVLFFASLKEKTGVPSLNFVLPPSEPDPAIGATLDSVKTALIAQLPQAADSLRIAVASINKEFAFPNDSIRDGDEVAFFPPVSGGAPEQEVQQKAQPEPLEAWPTLFELADQPISLDVLTAAITRPETGAVCVFSGVVRGSTINDQGVQHTARLEYEAYAEMATVKMKQVAAEIRDQFPGVQGIAIVQRIGVLEVGTPTVLIACASGHRGGGCFEAAQYGINRLKEIVPVWKKEISPDDPAANSWIEGHYQPVRGD